MNMRIEFDFGEWEARTASNYRRLCEPYYQIEQVFSPAEYDWPGDKEGRALLAFVCHAAMTGKQAPCMEDMIAQLPARTNRFGFFGPLPGDILYEQQLSGHNWYLRGLLEHYLLFHDQNALQYAQNTVEYLYLPTAGRYSTYPTGHRATAGDVSGNSNTEINGWLLSTDVGCAFMSVDGLAQYYEITQDVRVLALLREMREVFDSIDKLDIKAQTHCCLSAARGFIRLYKVTGDNVFLTSALTVYRLYIKYGMTLTYQNYNWWGRGNTWTEPCAVVDSLILATELYKLTGKVSYRTTAARIWHNGFAALQVGNGGAGTTSTVSATEPYLYTKLYEAYFCCTMRLAEGLRYAKEHAAFLYASTGELKQDSHGRYMAGDILYAEIHNKENEVLAMDNTVMQDGLALSPLMKYYQYPQSITEGIRQQVLFKK